MSFGNIDDHVYYRYPSMSWYMRIGSRFLRLLEWNWEGDNMKMWIENEDGQLAFFYFSIFLLLFFCLKIMFYLFIFLIDLYFFIMIDTYCYLFGTNMVLNRICQNF
jgi:hypothetical protein